MTWAGYLWADGAQHRRPHSHPGDRRNRALADPIVVRARPGAATALGHRPRPRAGGGRRRLPAPVALGIGRRLGDLARLALPQRHRLAVTNLAVAFPDLSRMDRGRLALASWQHFGMTLVELARFLGRPLQATLDELTIDGLDHVRGVMAEHGRALVRPRTAGTGSIWPPPPVMGYPWIVSAARLPCSTSLPRRWAENGAALIDKGAIRPCCSAAPGGLVESDGPDATDEGRSSRSSAARLHLKSIPARDEHANPIVPIFIRARRTAVTGWWRAAYRPPAVEVSSGDVELTAMNRRARPGPTNARAVVVVPRPRANAPARRGRSLRWRRCGRHAPRSPPRRSRSPRLLP